MQGLVKLADFGVAARLSELEVDRDKTSISVVGTPYWMAPEVIEMTSVTPASDIWSVACLAIELVTGAPPYYDLQPMSALFRIVQVTPNIKLVLICLACTSSSLTRGTVRAKVPCYASVSHMNCHIQWRRRQASYLLNEGLRRDVIFVRQSW